MTSIDKIYGNKEQYVEFQNWCEENNPQLLKYFYEDLENYDSLNYDEIRPITNFPEEIDNWLLNHCPLDWVINRIKFQYDIKD